MGYVGRRRARDEEGFSLVELLVIVVIMGILALIAIATYLTQAEKASRTSATSTLTVLHLAAESIRADRGTSNYAVTAGEYRTEQGTYEYVNGPRRGSTSPDEVSVMGGGDGSWVAFAVSSEAKCYYLRLERDVPGLAKASADVDGCLASDFGPSVPAGEWS